MSENLVFTTKSATYFVTAPTFGNGGAEHGWLVGPSGDADVVATPLAIAAAPTDAARKSRLFIVMA